MNKINIFTLVIIIFLLIDFYVFFTVKTLLNDKKPVVKVVFWLFYWSLTTISILGVVFYNKIDPKEYKNLRLFLTSFFFLNVISKLFIGIVILTEDIRRTLVYFLNFFIQDSTPTMSGRADFMKKTALFVGAVPISVLTFGIVSGAHDYRVRTKIIHFPNLPKKFDGIRIVQISDIHTGSFYNKVAVKGGVDLINQQKGDIVFFTGDLVNNQSAEAKDYLDIFKKISAPQGVYSIMGNHDYGDYKGWNSLEEKRKDILQIHQMHRYMGWDILLNENRFVEVEGEKMAILGVENWGKGRFAKYGNLSKAYQGTEETLFKILLSHDPSHWDLQIRPSYPDIDLTLSGHTHGMQFGIEIPGFRWSPSQYFYHQWADLYQMGPQYLYVNRGFGFLGYPGRVGILPEITVIELKRS